MQFDLANPKNGLQYQLADQLAHELRRVVHVFTESFKPVIEYFRLVDIGEKANPKVAHLAYHAKKNRVRVKNLKRLYRIGCLIEKQKKKQEVTV